MYQCQLIVHGHVALVMNVQMHDQSGLRQELVTAQMYKHTGCTTLRQQRQLLLLTMATNALVCVRNRHQLSLIQSTQGFEILVHQHLVL
jgi:hypothetical protein